MIQSEDILEEKKIDPTTEVIGMSELIELNKEENKVAKCYLEDKITRIKLSKKEKLDKEKAVKKELKRPHTTPSIGTVKFQVNQYNSETFRPFLIGEIKPKVLTKQISEPINKDKFVNDKNLTQIKNKQELRTKSAPAKYDLEVIPKWDEKELNVILKVNEDVLHSNSSTNNKGPNVDNTENTEDLEKKNFTRVSRSSFTNNNFEKKFSKTSGDINLSVNLNANIRNSLILNSHSNNSLSKNSINCNTDNFSVSNKPRVNNANEVATSIASNLKNSSENTPVGDGIKEKDLRKTELKSLVQVSEACRLNIQQFEKVQNKKKHFTKMELDQANRIPASQFKTNSHENYCAGVTKNSNFTKTHKQKLEEQEVLDKKNLEKNGRQVLESLKNLKKNKNLIWEIKKKKKYMLQGKTNLNSILDLNCRGPGWFWSKNPKNKTWNSILGLKDDEEINFSTAVIWPSKKAGKGMGLRNIETCNGLTVSGTAGEERICEVDRSQGILRKVENVEEFFRVKNKICRSEKNLNKLNNVIDIRDQTENKNAKTFYNVINDYEGNALDIPKRRDIIKQLEPRIQKTWVKESDNNRYRVNTDWKIDTKTLIQAPETGTYYMHPRVYS
ncbi:hypothetical protein HK099_003733 [Clydaea vesicula]|uniref:Uncharacterized protein n=1 Tax=Clydaea vesicula TaxID=447962 RepID=A0AAD5U199_9FUNG|nr:hypothetical protein HK099_003733 [Clydaea vesicula]